MIAMAIDELRPAGGQPTEGHIGIWGVEMEYGTEYRQQRVGFRHFIAIAHLLGIPVSRSVAGGLAYEPVPYPMWQDDPLLNKVEQRRDDSSKELAELDESIRLTRSLIAQNHALMNELPRTMKDDYDAAARMAELEKETENLMKTSAGLSKSIVALEAVNDEQGWLLDYLSP
jgi:hypothetical protein